MRRGAPVSIVRTAFALCLATAAIGGGIARGDGVPAADPPRAAPVPAAAESEREEAGPVLYESEVDGAGDARTVVLRVVDEFATTPIAGAAVSVHKEAQHPVPGVVAPLASGTTDASGWVRIDVAGKFPGDTPWIYVEAKGYAPMGIYGVGRKEPVALRRGEDLVVELRDAFERPVAGARVGLHLGCGHTPDVRDVTTDAAGRAALANVTPACATELWVVSPGLESTYHDLSMLPGDGPRVLRQLPAPPVEGRVVGLDGRPIAGAAVGTRAFHRGPWTRTDADGRFRLLGCTVLPGSDGLVVETAEPPTGRHVPGTPFPRPPYGVAAVVKIGPPPKEAVEEEEDEESPQAPAAPVTRVHVSLRATKRRILVEGARVAVARDADGLTLADDTDEQGEVTFDLPRGAWTVHVGASAGDTSLEWAPTTAPLLVVDDGPQLLRIDVVPVPTQPVDLAALPGDVSVQVVTPTRVLAVASDPESPAHEVPLPTDEPAALRCFARGLVRVTPLPRPGTPEADVTLVVAWFPVQRVTARFVGPDGAPAEARAVLVAMEDPRFDDVAPARDAVLESPAEAGLRLVVEPSDPHLRRRVIPLPEASDVSDHDLGEVRLEAAAPAPLVLLPDGSPAPDVAVVVERGGKTFAGTTGEGGRLLDVDQDAAGVLAGGARVHAFLPGGDLRALHAVLEEGAAGWTLRWPTASISWTVEDEAGGPVEGAVVAIDGERRLLADGAVLCGLPAGPHEVVVSAPGRRARVYTVVLKDGEERRIAAKLRRP